MKAYCKSCEAIQPSSFRPCTDAVTGASYEDLCCDSCHYIVATVEEREALAQPAQKPVAWWNNTGTHIDLNVSGRGTPLYTAPPQRPWVDLTDDEICKLEGFYDFMTKEEFFDAIRKVEAKLKEKNT